MGVLKILRSSWLLTRSQAVMLERRSIYSKPPRNKIGAGQSFLIMSVFAVALLAPAGWILHHLPEYRQRPRPTPKA
ncbi:COX8 domain-containing protein [Lampris incognitus]|uniref:COX8 domain-containing protein n=1 Tax=Lampris incognitus TaxID=2546036 RepID=UPI0024B5431A|nr:COX8 domain-containing protein [Lampris incognitus]